MGTARVGFVPQPVALCDYMVGSVDNSTAVYVEYLCFRKAFDVISCHILKTQVGEIRARSQQCAFVEKAKCIWGFLARV